MKYMDLTYWPARPMAVLALIMGMTVVNGQPGGLLGYMNFDPLIYGIVTIGAGLIIVIWFMHKVNQSYIP